MKSGFFILLLCLPFMVFSGTSLKDLYKRGYIKLEKKLDITNEAFEKKFFISSFHSYNVSKEGRVFLTAYRLNKLVIIDSKGRLVKTSGQLGQGPGDLSGPNNIIVNGKELAIYELRNRRFSIFSHRGDFIKTFPPSPYIFILNAETMPDKNYMIQTYDTVRGKEEITQVSSVSIYDRNFKKTKAVYSRPVFLNKFMNGTNYPQPFSSNVSASVNYNGEIIAGYHSDDYLTIISGAEKKTFKHKLKKKPVTKEDEEEFFEGITYTDHSGKSTKGASKEFRKATTFPEFHPYYNLIKTDPEGNILLFSENAFFYAYDKDGNFISKVDIKEGKVFARRIKFIGPRTFFTSLEDSENDEEPHIYKYMIK